MSAPMRVGETWHKVLLANVSKTGFMAKADPTPPEGAKVELRHRSVSITGKAVRRAGRRFAVKADEPIDLDALLAKSGLELKSPDSDSSGKGWLWHWRNR